MCRVHVLFLPVSGHLLNMHVRKLDPTLRLLVHPATFTQSDSWVNRHNTTTYNIGGKRLKFVFDKDRQTTCYVLIIELGTSRQSAIYNNTEKRRISKTTVVPKFSLRSKRVTFSSFIPCYLPVYHTSGNSKRDMSLQAYIMSVPQPCSSWTVRHQLPLTDEYSVFPYSHVRILCEYENILRWFGLAWHWI